MESASHWTLSLTAVSVMRVTVAPSVTSKESCLTRAADCPANTAAVRSQTQEMHTVTAKVATLGNFVMQVVFLCVCAIKTVRMYTKRLK